MHVYIYAYRSDDVQYLELFQAITTIDQNMNISVSLSVNSELMLEEPLFIMSVITFGIEGGCVLEKLIVNASTDDILYGNHNIILYMQWHYVAQHRKTQNTSIRITVNVSLIV